MKLLKKIFQNALVLATLATVGAGAILVAHADREAVEARKGAGVALKADEDVPLNLIAASGRRGSGTARQADEGKPPGMAS
jgi:hypothetical protein